MEKKLRIIYGWLFIRPIRYCFCRMMVASCGVVFIPHRHKYLHYWKFPNIHWWLLYKTVFKFCKYLYWDGWRPFCKWENGFRQSLPLIARIIKRIGETTAGYVIGGGQCFHCGSPEGCQVELSEEESDWFKLIDTWTVGTQEGTDHRFKGITTCPKCGYQAEYEDGSL